jgi:hypothetical protein
MWQVENLTPFADERAWVRAPDGSEVWLVAVKATFEIVLETGQTEVADEQPPVLRLPEHHGDPSTSSIKYDCDLVYAKHATDILVIGHAHAPNSVPVEWLDCGFEVGTLSKHVRVFGDRVWGALGPSRPQPFVSMPLIWERAFGGVDERSSTPQTDWYWQNPVGRGFVTAAARAAGRPLPNLEDPNYLISGWRDRPSPAGFGVVASHWQPRIGFAGTYDERWTKTRNPLPPDDFDLRFLQSALPDQQAPHFLVGGEPVLLRHLHPRGSIAFDLPTVRLDFESRFVDGTRERHPPCRLHTVILEPDHPRVSLVWHSALPCHVKGDLLDRTVVTLRDDEALDVSLGGDGRGDALRRARVASTVQ